MSEKKFFEEHPFISKTIEGCIGLLFTAGGAAIGAYVTDKITRMLTKKHKPVPVQDEEVRVSTHDVAHAAAAIAQKYGPAWADNDTAVAEFQSMLG